MKKECNKCKETKPLTEFTKDKRLKSGYGGQCKSCKNKRQAKKPITEEQREKNRIKARKHYYRTIDKQRQRAKDKYHSFTEEEKSEKLKKHKQRYHKNKDAINEKRREQYKNDPSLREKNSQRMKAHYEKNKEKIIQNNVEYARHRRQTDIVYRIQRVVSNAVWYAVTGHRGSKGGKTFDELPYSPHDLKEHLEQQFDENMTWDNYGSYWHIDHIYPHSKLPYDSIKHPNFQKAWALSNLRPLNAKENQSKGNKIITEDKE